MNGQMPILESKGSPYAMGGIFSKEGKTSSSSSAKLSHQGLAAEISSHPAVMFLIITVLKQHILNIPLSFPLIQKRET